MPKALLSGSFPSYQRPEHWTRVVHMNRCKKAAPQPPDSWLRDGDPDPVPDTSTHGTNLDGAGIEREESLCDLMEGFKRPIRQRRASDRYGDWVTGYAPTSFEGEDGVKYRIPICS